ncbi:MAG: hypothetical protein ACODAD_07620 [Planctomycetota bacterium]
MPWPRILPDNLFQSTLKSQQGTGAELRPWSPLMLRTITNDIILVKRFPSKSAGGDGVHLLADCITEGRQWYKGPGEVFAKRKRSPRDRFSASTFGHWMTLLAFVTAFAWGLLAGGNPLYGEEDTFAGGQSSPSRTVVLDLSKKELYVVLSINADPEAVAITDVRIDDLPSEHSEHALFPASGEARLGRPLDIRLKEPSNIRIRLSVVKRGKKVALRVSPQIMLGRNRTIELTQDRVTRTARNANRYLKQLNRQLAGLARERRALNVWLAAPGNKPLETVETVHMRLKILNQSIKNGKRDIPAVKRQCAAIGQAATFVRELHESVKIRYAVRVSASEGE